MFIEWFSFAIVCLLTLAVAAGLAVSPHLRFAKNVLMAGALMRIVGVFARHAMVFDIYGGAGDAVGYWDAGLVIADHFRRLDFSIFGSGRWGEQEWGTQAVRYATGLVIAAIGPSVRGAFLVFSLAAFVGLACTAIAFGRAFNARSVRHCAWLLFFWPSLLFWPSSIGKEATLMLALGLVTLGYVGRGERIQWVPLVCGFLLAVVVRPHLAGVLAVSMCFAEWVGVQWTIRRVAQSIVATGLAVWLLSVSFDLLGLADADISGMEAYLLDTAKHTELGGSSFERSSSLATSMPLAFVNLLGRPFVFEAHNGLAFVSSLEMMAFWALLAFKRDQLITALRSWPENRLLRFVLSFSVLYILMIGMTFQNLGMIARQRTLVMPALLLIAAVPSGGVANIRRPSAPQPAVRTRRIWTTRPRSRRAASTLRRS
jgi:hypothetical protein